MKKIFILFMGISFIGCSKEFLEKDSLTQIADANFWQTEQDVQLGINGVYDALQDRALYSGNLNATAGLPMYDCLGDNLHNNYKWEGPGNFMIGIIDPTHAMFRTLWSASYRGIGRANTAIANIEKMPVSAIGQDKKNGYLGQALFLRALFYFNLAVYFEDVPLITKVQALEDAYVPKNTYQEVSVQIIKDLNDAAALLPVSYPSTQYGYATRGAALGLLARFHMYNKNYQGALDATSSLLSLGYSLNPSYAQLFTEQGELSREIVFSVRFNQDVSNNGETFSATFLGAPKIDQNPMPNMVREYNCTDGRPITTSPLYNANNPKANRDPRLAASVFFRNDIFLTDLNRAFTGNTPTTFGLRKYARTSSVSGTGIQAFNPGGQDFIVIRYADILLMRAEALIELGQLTPEVYNLINQVRSRVSMPTVQSVEGASLSQAALRDVLRKERRVELAFEGLRYFDLKRWGQVQNAFNTARLDNVANYAVIYLPGKAEVFPIPLDELNVNSKLVQHPAWQ
ncbi:MAG TPA: hypothetical protein DCL43_12485 [Chitinophagaceae bacterium]|nr:hypothetical protein [Chitinophagaceae bacterium]HAN38104.1 hypothetical protein [Chitinophagaceae bacterium]